MKGAGGITVRSSASFGSLEGLPKAGGILEGTSLNGGSIVDAEAAGRNLEDLVGLPVAILRGMQINFGW